MNTTARHSFDDPHYWVGDEEVAGQIIGDMTQTYGFFMREEIAPGHFVTNIIGNKMEFSTDDEAIAWFREHFPVDYANGVEMRVW